MCRFSVDGVRDEDVVAKFKKANDFIETFDPVENGQPLMTSETVLLKVDQGVDIYGTYGEDVKTINLHKKLVDVVRTELRSIFKDMAK